MPRLRGGPTVRVVTPKCQTDLRVLDGLYAIQTIFASASLHGHVQNGVGSALFRFGDKKVSGAAGKLVLKKVPTVATLKGIGKGRCTSHLAHRGR